MLADLGSGGFWGKKKKVRSGWLVNNGILDTC